MDKRTLVILTGFGLGGLGLGWYLLSRSKGTKITTTPREINLSITSVLHDSGKVTVTVKNTGNVEYTFYIGCTVVANGIAGEGCELNASGNPYVDIPLQSITLAPGETGQVYFDISQALQQLSQYSTLYVIVKGYKDMAQQCITGTSIQVTNPYYQPTPGLTITNVYYSGGKVYVTVQSTGTDTFTYLIGCTVVAKGVCGSGCDLNACGNPYVDIPWQSVTLDPGQSTTVTFDITSAMQQLSQYKDLYVIVKGWVNL